MIFCDPTAEIVKDRRGGHGTPTTMLMFGMNANGAEWSGSIYHIVLCLSEDRSFVLKQHKVPGFCLRLYSDIDNVK